MAKVALILALFFNTLIASNLDKYCLNCHINNKLPTKLIYKRYLMKYSTNTNMKKAIFNYLTNPNPKNSIMPKEFFLKFKPKSITNIDNKKLYELIDEFLQKYDIKKRLK